MSLKDQLKEDMKAAMKAREEGKTALSVIRMVNSAIKNTEINDKVELDDNGILGILAKEMKTRQDSLTEFEKAGREELSSVFVGPSAVAFSNEDVIAPAKILNDFSKNAEALEIKGGAIEGAVASKEEILALATLPNREGLLSMLLSVLQAPVRNVALAVKAVADNKEDAA